MTKSVFTAKYEFFRHLLIEERKSRKLTQYELAVALKKPQSYVSKYERGERRLDLVEFLEIADALAIQIEQFIQRIKNYTPGLDNADIFS